MNSPVLTCRKCGQPNDATFGHMEFHLACLRSGAATINNPALRAAIAAKYPDIRASLVAASGTHDRVREAVELERLIDEARLTPPTYSDQPLYASAFVSDELVYAGFRRGEPEAVEEWNRRVAENRAGMDAECAAYHASPNPDRPRCYVCGADHDGSLPTGLTWDGRPLAPVSGGDHPSSHSDQAIEAAPESQPAYLEILSVGTFTEPDPDGEPCACGDPDCDLAERYQRGEYGFIGIYAAAEVVIGGTVQTFRTGGLWGIEDDWTGRHSEVEKEELEELRAIIEEIGAIDPADLDLFA